MSVSKKKKFLYLRLVCLCLLIVLLIGYAETLTLAALSSAFADETYQWVRVTEDNVCLYADNRHSKVICVLEKSYYARVLENCDAMLFVSIMQNEPGFPEICGYVYTDEVEPTEKDPVTPYYPSEKVTVNSDSASLKLSPVPSAETVVTATNTQQLSYYGEIESYGKTWYYVCYAGKFGYVDASCVVAPAIALHPTPLKTDVPVVVPPSDVNEPSEPTEPPKDVSPTSEILLIVFVVLLAVGLTLALFLPGNRGKKKKDNVFDNNI